MGDFLINDLSYIDEMISTYKNTILPKLEKGIVAGFRIATSYDYNAQNYIGGILPVYSDTSHFTNILRAAKLCEAIGYFIQPHYNIGNSLTSVVTDLRGVPNQPNNASLMDYFNSFMLGPELSKQLNSSVKYIYDTTGYVRKLTTGILPVIYPLYIKTDPYEQQYNGQTIRILTSYFPKLVKTAVGRYAYMDPANGSAYSAGIYAITPDSPVYNYLDKNHVVFFITDSAGEHRVLVTNNLTLDTYYTVMAISLNYEANKSKLQNGVFINALDLVGLRRDLVGYEKNIPPAARIEYLKYKSEIKKHFDEHIGDVSLHRYLRGELSELTISDINFAKDKITYQNVSLEYPDCGAYILKRLDSTQALDIYEIIDCLVKDTVAEYDKLPINEAGTGFLEDKSTTITINSIPITLSVSARHTRRSINGKFINNDELVRVIARAACFTEVSEFEKFVAQVSRFSLRVHSAIANGVVLKLAAMKDEQDFSYHQPPSHKVHPRMLCVQEGHNMYLMLDKETGERVKLERFVGFLNAIKTFNSKVNNQWTREDDGAQELYRYRNLAWGKYKIKQIIREFVKDSATLLTEETLDAYLESLFLQHKSARKKSEELLASVVKSTKSEACTLKGLEGYKVTGKLRTYFVEKETSKVWDYNNPASYVCIVDASRGNMGAGFDALVARILALSNDERMVNRIHTLKT